MPSEMATIIITLFIFLDYPRQSLNQDAFFLPLPLGQFRFISTFPGSGTPVSKTTTQSLAPFALIDRPGLDTSVPAGVDAASIAAQGEAIKAFINACPREMRLAWLRCPCAHPGGRCADPYSVCSLENKCKCDGRLGYPDPAGERCVPYVISTTKLSTATTSTAKTSTTTATTKASTTTTITSTTTTTTVPTTPLTFAGCAAIGGTNPPVRTLTITDTIVLTSPDYPSSTLIKDLDCTYSFQPPPGKSVKIEFIPPFDLTDPPIGTCNSAVQISNDMFVIKGYCATDPPPPDYTFTADTLAASCSSC